MTAPVDLPQLTALLERHKAAQEARAALHRRYPDETSDEIEAKFSAASGEVLVSEALLSAAAVNALPALIAELTAARERLAVLERMHDECICPKCGVRHGGQRDPDRGF